MAILNEGVRPELMDVFLAKRNITWEIDESTRLSMENAIREARTFLRRRAGVDDFNFLDPDDEGLLITAAFYFLEGRRADFGTDYAEELNNFRLRACYGIG